MVENTWSAKSAHWLIHFFEWDFVLSFNKGLRALNFSGVARMALPSFGNPPATAKVEEKVLREFVGS